MSHCADHVQILPFYTGFQSHPLSMAKEIVDAAESTFEKLTKLETPVINKFFDISTFLGGPIMIIVILGDAAIFLAIACLSLASLVVNWFVISPFLFIMDLISYPIRYLAAVSIDKADYDNFDLIKSNMCEYFSLQGFCSTLGLFGLLYLIVGLI